jgi:PAP2 superfamily
MSDWLFEFERRILWQRRRRALIVILAALLVLLLADSWLYHTVAVPLPPKLPSEDHGAVALAQEEYQHAINHLEQNDFYRTFRVVGTLWPWLLVCGALVAQCVASRPIRRHDAAAGIMIVLSAALSGLGAEILRVLTGRLRPNAATPPGVHQFRGILERFQHTENLAFPSSHAAVAFGAAFMVWFVYPRAGLVALLAAAGCGLTRMASGAHFASDVFGGALLGYAIARALRPGGWLGERRGLILP